MATTWLALLSPVVRADLFDDVLTAANQNDTEQLLGYLRKGIAPDTSDIDGNTLLISAARQGNETVVDELILRGAKVRSRNRFGDDALMVAAFKGALPVVKMLVSAGAELNRDEGWTALIYAAFNGHVETMEYLIAQGADVDADSDNGTTALMVAARNGHEEAVKLLLKHEADPNDENQAGGTALRWALAAGHTTIADILRAAGARD